MREVKKVATDVKSRIQITTASGSVYELSELDSDGNRTLTKNTTKYVGKLGIAANAQQLAKIYTRQGVLAGTALTDGRMIILDQTLTIGDCLGFVFNTGSSLSGLASSQIAKIEIGE